VKLLYKKILLLLIFFGFISLFAAIFAGEVILRIIACVSDFFILAGLIFLLISFTRKLLKITSQLQIASSGTFTTDFPEKINDELDFLSMKLSSLFRNMMKYDNLRAKDVSQSLKAYSLLSYNISEAVILLDLEENTAILNPAAQKIWKVESREFPLDVVTKHAQNIAFAKFIKGVVDEKAENETVGVYFPSSSKIEVSLKAVPVKTIEGKIPLVILFAKNTSEQNDVNSIP